jgi:hypothetical protein
VTIASAQFNPDSIVLDDTRVYWANGGANDFTAYGSIVTAPLRGGQPATLAAGLSVPQSLALAGATLYWVEYGAFRIDSMPRSGGKVAIFSLMPADTLGIDGTDVYWTSESVVEGFVTRQALTGGSTATLATDPKGAVWIALGASDVYWTPGSQGSSVMTVPKSGGKASPVASGCGGTPFAVDEAYAYEVTSSGVLKCPLGAGTLTALVPETDASAASPAIAVDADSVYFATADGLQRVSKAGGGVTTLSTERSTVSAIAVNATSVYWATSGSFGKILMVTPK